MRVEVSQLPDRVESDARPCDPRVRSSSRGRPVAVGPEGDVQSGQQPVVGAVFEEVEEGHCGGGEAVEEEGFEFAFQEVQGYEDAGEGLERGWRGVVR